MKKQELVQYFGKDNRYLKFIDYLDKDIEYVITELKNGSVNCEVNTRKVFNPKTSRSVPGHGSDLVIGDYSINSKYIYDINNKEIYNRSYSHSLKYYNVITLMTYCSKEQVEEVKSKHIKLIKDAIVTLKKELFEQIESLNNTTKKI